MTAFGPKFQANLTQDGPLVADRLSSDRNDVVRLVTDFAKIIDADGAETGRSLVQHSSLSCIYRYCNCPSQICRLMNDERVEQYDHR